MKPQDEALFKEPSATKQEREQQHRAIEEQRDRPAGNRDHDSDTAAAEQAKEKQKKGRSVDRTGPRPRLTALVPASA